MKVPVSAKVACQEGECGRLSLLVIDARRNCLVQMVIETFLPPESALPQDRKIPLERLVPAALLVDMNKDTIRLGCSRAQLLACPPLARRIQVGSPGLLFRVTPDATMSWPYYYIASQAEEKIILPPGAVGIDQNAGVISVDERRVGKVAGLELDPASKRLTGLDIYEGAFWKRREVVLPITNVNRFEEDTVYINQAYRKVAHLPGVPVQ